MPPIKFCAPVRLLTGALATAAYLATSASVLDAAVFARDGAHVEIHIGPSEDLEAVDRLVIHQARSSIDLAAYVLTDLSIIDALVDRARDGVIERIYLDPSQLRGGREENALLALARDPCVEVRVKPVGALMHLKFMVVDGVLLRTGSANMSRSGLTQQDNDIIVIEDAAAAARYERQFEEMWDRKDNGSLSSAGRD